MYNVAAKQIERGIGLDKNKNEVNIIMTITFYQSHGIKIR